MRPLNGLKLDSPDLENAVWDRSKLTIILHVLVGMVTDCIDKSYNRNSHAVIMLQKMKITVLL
jgi:hypothetical protein